MKDDESPIIRIMNVSKTYHLGGETVHALREVSLNVRSGEYVSIMGPSGSGKTTLFNMIGGLDSPSLGNVVVEGYRLTDLNTLQLAWFRCHRIGFIFQTFNLIPTMTALENVAIARIFSGVSYEQACDDAAKILQDVGLGHRLSHLPSEISGGQQQRVAIARALVNEPSIVLADEPTGNLDLHTGEEIINLLGKMRDDLGITIVAATHDMKMLSASDTVILISNGSVDQIAMKGDVEIRVGTIDGETVA